jgi:hypothetical protein
MKPSSFARLSGVSLMVSAVLEMALGVMAANAPMVLSPSAPSSLEVILWNSLAAVSRALALIGIIGLARGGAAGNSALGKIGLGLAVLGLALNVPIIASGAVKVTLLAQMLDGMTATLYALGLTLAGLAVLLARRWQGWHRFMPLLLGLYVLLVVTPYVVISRGGPDLPWFVASSDVFTLLLGGALYAEAGHVARGAPAS